MNVSAGGAAVGVNHLTGVSVAAGAGNNGGAGAIAGAENKAKSGTKASAGKANGQAPAAAAAGQPTVSVGPLSGVNVARPDGGKVSVNPFTGVTVRAGSSAGLPPPQPPGAANAGKTGGKNAA